MSKLDEFAVVVFDLDDTLYSERDYVESGWDCLGELVQRLYGRRFRALLGAAQQAGEADVLGCALAAAGLPASLKEHLLAVYRYHQPAINLHQGALELLEGCRRRGCPLYLITDGRSVTQRLKLDALGLAESFDAIYISEEIGRGKPDPLAFESVARKHQGRMVYVADNPSKDFVAPTKLGWTTIGVRHGSNRVHPAGRSLQEPTFWVEDLADLLAP